MATRLGTPLGAPPPCLRPPDGDPAPLVAQAKPMTSTVTIQRPGAPTPPPPAAPVAPPPPPPPANAPPQIVRFVQMVAPEYQLDPHVVLAVIHQESNFDPLAQSPKNAMGLMQLIPDTARRFNVRNITDPAQNIRGGMAYLRWLLAYFEGDLMLALAAYNAGERAVERYPRRAALRRDAAVRAQDHRRHQRPAFGGFRPQGHSAVRGVDAAAQPRAQH